MSDLKQKRRAVFSVFIFVFLCPLSGAKKDSDVFGHSAHPFFDKNGNLRFAYVNKTGTLSLAAHITKTGEEKGWDLSGNTPVSSPVIKIDKKGDIWAVWEEAFPQKNDICIAKLENNQIIWKKKLNENDGFPISPDFGFDRANSVWAAWIQYTPRKSSIIVKNLDTQESWNIDDPFISSAHSPKIVPGANNRIWIFWTGNVKGKDALFWSAYNGFEWSVPSKIHKEGASPQILPDADADWEGNPWIVWSAYDGNDYEIFCSYWRGEEWSQAEKITDNSEMDTSPAVTFVSDGIPVVAWCAFSHGRSQIFCKYKHGEGWSQKILIAQALKIGIVSLKIAAKANTVGFVWESHGRIESSIIDLQTLFNKSSLLLTDNGPVTAVNSSLKENAYIGFGDSITYGYMDYKEAPDLGYIPRLEKLLTETYGPTVLINEGWPGEVTLAGLGRIKDVIGQYSARYLLLMEGTNDVIFHQFSMETTAFHLEQMALICRDFGVFPVLSTIIPRNDWRWGRLYYRERIFELNEKIQNLAEDLRIPLVDQFNFFYNYPAIDGGWKSLLSVDQVHPSIKGYEIMTKAWLVSIQQLPFPPESVRAKRVFDQILFSKQTGNSLFWMDSFRLDDINNFLAYHIYRKDLTEKEPEFTLIHSLSLASSMKITGNIGFPKNSNSGYSYTDLRIDPSHRYAYTIALSRKDTVEGPCSQIAQDK